METPGLPESDRIFFFWLQLLPVVVEVKWQEDGVCVHCQNDREASAVLGAYQKAGMTARIRVLTPEGLYIDSGTLSIGRPPECPQNRIGNSLLGGRPMITMHQQASAWARQNENAIAAIPKATIYFVKTDSTILAIRPDITEKRLAKPIAELLGTSIANGFSEQGDQRRFYINQVVGNGGVATRKYHANWGGIFWEFEERFAYLPGADEVMIVVSDDDDRPDQRKYWQRLVAEGKA